MKTPKYTSRIELDQRSKERAAPCIYGRANLSPQTKSIDEAWVVPCSPKLFLMFQCHLKVALSASQVVAITYRFK